MGGSSSQSKKETNITTNTKTTMGDIGLTGKNAVDMAAIMQTGAIEQTRISASTLDNLMQTVGKTSQQLIGGASDMVRTYGDVVSRQGAQSAGVLGNLMNVVSEFSRDMLGSASESSKELIGGAGKFISAQRAVTTGESTDLVKIAPWIAIAAVVALPLLMRKK